LSVWADAAPTQNTSATGAAKRKIARFMKQPFLRDCPWGLDYKLRDLSGFFYAMIERVDVPASVACPHARIRVGLSAISERSAMAVKGLTVAALDAMTAC